MAVTWKSPQLFRMTFVCLLGFAIMNGVILWRVRGQMAEGYGDFASFYAAGRMVALGESDRLYDPPVQWQVQQQFAANVKTRRGPLPYIRPPYQALLFWPLSYLPYPTAAWVWMALKATILLTIPWLLPPANTGEPNHLILKTLSCFGFFPVGFDLLQGQDSILLLLIVVAALRLLMSDADALSGVVLALGLFKFHIIVPLFLIIILKRQAAKRRVRFVAGFGGAALTLFLISLAMVHWSGVLRYPRYLWMLNLVPGLGMVKPQSMPDARGMLTVLLGNGALPAIAQWFLAVVVFAGIAMAAAVWRDDGRAATLRAFSLAIVLLLVTSYYANSYDLTLLLIPLLVLGEQFLNASAGWPRTLFLIAAGVLACTPLLWLAVLKADQFCWIGLIVAALGVSIHAESHRLRRSVTASVSG
jgi:hypothetical protein